MINKVSILFKPAIPETNYDLPALCPELCFPLFPGIYSPHGQVSLKMQNIELVFDVSVLSDFKHRKFDGRMDLTSNFKMDITSNKLGHFSF